MPDVAHPFAVDRPAGGRVRSSLPRPGAWRVSRGVALACLVPWAAGCEDVVVAPATVSTVEVVPAAVQVPVGENTALSADLKDEAGRSISGHPITWTSDDDRIAAVNASGQVSGAGSGTTTIRARVGGVEGTATVHVLGAPVIALSRSSVGFSADEGASPPPPVDVGVTNDGEAPLTGLQAATSYSAGASGWLSVNLASTTAPTTLTLAVNVAGLQPGEYRADVTVSAGSTQAAAVTLPVALEIREVVGTPPATPSGLSASGSLTSVQLSWTANSDDETEFRIHRRTGSSGSHQQIATVGAGVTSFTDSDVEPATTYGYRVRACNDHGCSSLSSEATASTGVAAPLAPSNLRVAMNQRHRVRVEWTNTNPIPARVRVERAVGSGQFSVLQTTDPGVTFYDDRSVERRTTYRYRVFACIAGVCSGASNIITVTTPD